jgi:hypothetical protein
MLPSGSPRVGIELSHRGDETCRIGGVGLLIGTDTRPRTVSMMSGFAGSISIFSGAL